MILVTIAEKITVNIEVDKAGIKYLNKFFRIDNPKLAILKKLGKRGFGVPAYIYLYKLAANRIIFNRGDIEKVKTFLNFIKLPYEIKKDLKGEKIKLDWNKEIVLRDYQNKVLQSGLENDQGCFIVPAGGGKTITGMKLIKEIGLKTLWVTHTKDLLYQSADAFKMCLGYAAGIIGDGKQDVKDVTIATVQTLSNRPKLIEELKKTVGLIIVDECHHVPTNYFSKVLQEFKPKFVFGLTATPDRKDNMQDYMYSVIGKKLIEIDRNLLYKSNKLVIPVLTPIYTDFEGDTINLDQESVDLGGDGSNYHELIKKLISDEKRQDLIVNTIVEKHKNEKNLCLVEWVAYGEIILKKLKEMCPLYRIEFIHGKVNKNDRKNILKDFKENKIDILFATKLAREGLDLPNLTQLFLLTPKKGDSKSITADGSALEQEVGRVMRPDPSNHEKVAKVVDFVDYKNGILRNQWYTRRRTYKRLQIEVLNKEKNKILHVKSVFSEFL